MTAFLPTQYSRIVCAILGLLRFGSADAADNPFAGWHIGGTIGGGYVARQIDLNLIPFHSNAGINGGNLSVPFRQSGSTGTPSLGFFGGGSVGITDRLTLGLEGDWNWQHSQAAIQLSPTLSGQQRSGTASFIDYTSTNNVSGRVWLDWIATVKLRVGYNLNPNIQIFASAGPAVTQMRSALSHSAVVTSEVFFLGTRTPLPTRLASASFSDRKTAIGFRLTGGAEYRLASPLSLRGEVAFTRFHVPAITNPPDGSVFGGSDDAAGSLSLITAAIGLVYRF